MLQLSHDHNIGQSLKAVSTQRLLCQRYKVGLCPSFFLFGSVHSSNISIHPKKTSNSFTFISTTLITHRFRRFSKPKSRNSTTIPKLQANLHNPDFNMQFTNYQITFVAALAASISSAIASPVFTPQTTCKTPQAGEPSTFTVCAFPNTAAQLTNTAPVVAYLKSQGCVLIYAQQANGNIDAEDCGSGTIVSTQSEVPGWTVVTDFLTPACLPGNQCL